MEKIDFNSYIVKKQEKPYSERASIVKEFIEIFKNYAYYNSFYQNIILQENS
jgi:hypothetical protein